MTGRVERWGPDLCWGAVETTYGVRRNVRFRSTPQWPFPPGSSFKLQDLRTIVMDLHTVCWTRFCRTGLRRQVPGVLDGTSSVRLRATDSMLDAFNGEIPEAEGGGALKLVVARRSITCRFRRASGTPASTGSPYGRRMVTRPDPMYQRTELKLSPLSHLGVNLLRTLDTGVIYKYTLVHALNVWAPAPVSRAYCAFATSLEIVTFRTPLTSSFLETRTRLEPHGQHILVEHAVVFLAVPLHPLG